jgi:RNA polymerase sigma-70 factor (ECF subfamily)
VARRQLLELRPRDPETIALLAMLVLHGARRPARLDSRGRLVAFADQDPDRWDRAALERARTLLGRTGHSPPGPYRLQAAIVAVQTFAAADGRPLPWHHIDRLYTALARQTPTPVVDVNRAVAAARARGPQAGLAILETVASGGRLRDYAPFHAAHADLLEQAGHADRAAAAWARALACSKNPAQRARLGQLARRRAA